MPVENEIKYVLKSYDENRFRELASEVLNIEQGYLCYAGKTTVRIRKINENHFLTVKHKNGKVIEIENKIEESDYKELIPNASCWLKKTRYLIDGWEIDFFKKDITTYFVMAEIELPEGILEPEIVPGFIAENLLYKVPKEDCRFSSRKLSDIVYAQNLLVGLKNKYKKSKYRYGR